MPAVTWIAFAYAFIKAVPDMVSFAKTVAGIVNSIEDFWQRRQQLGQLNDALKTAHQTGDTSKLEKFFSGVGNANPTAQPAQLPTQPTNP